MKSLTVIKNNGEQVVVANSRTVANNFGKRHGDVIAKIEDKLTNEKIRSLNYFIKSSYIDAKGEERKEYLMTRDGFTFIVMGFTGEKADGWKLKYIEDFNEMERQLHEIKEKVDAQGSISKEEFYEIHFGNAKRIRKAFEMTDDLNELFSNFLEYVSKMNVTEKVKRYEHLQKVLDDILNVRVRDLSIELNEVICLRSEITNMKLKLEELINETLNRSYAQQLRYAKEKANA